MGAFESIGPGRLFAAGAGLLGVFAMSGILGTRFWGARGGASPSGNRPPREQWMPTDEPSHFAMERRRMVEEQLRQRDIRDERVLEVMGRVPRQYFMPPDVRHLAYSDRALPIEENQTISQPYIVALMTQLAQLNPQSRVLEIGTGSGYQTAILAELCKEVYSIEIIESLASTARERLTELGYQNVTLRRGDGYQGWPEHGPYDAILVTAAPGHIPRPLEQQLAVGGRLVIPLGHYYQELMLLEKRQDGTMHRKPVLAVQFVPMTGEAEHWGK